MWQDIYFIPFTIQKLQSDIKVQAWTLIQKKKKEINNFFQVEAVTVFLSCEYKLQTGEFCLSNRSTYQHIEQAPAYLKNFCLQLIT